MSDLVKWFCPYCWKELDKDYETCPYCRKSLKDFINLDFDEKLILGLDNPVTENRMLIIEVVGKRKVKKAIDKLCNMLFDKRDTYELMEIIKAVYNIDQEKARICVQKIKKNTKNNKILKSFIEYL